MSLIAAAWTWYTWAAAAADLSFRQEPAADQRSVRGNQGSANRGYHGDDSQQAQYQLEWKLSVLNFN